MASMTDEGYQRSTQRFIPEDAHATANFFSRRSFAIIVAARRREWRGDLRRDQRFVA
jgi:hypothetical protein